MKMAADKRELSKIYKRRDRYEIPDWQRQRVWDKSKKQLLIDSILRGWKLPKFYFLKISDNPEEFDVVDGQQRLNAIFEFFANELSLSEESSIEFGGAFYRDLPALHSDNFDDFEIEYDVIEDADDSELKQFFQRLQQGLPLTSSEKLNSEHSNLRDFCRELAKHPFFKTKVVLKDTRYAHFDVVTKVAAIEIEGLEVSLRYEGLKNVFASQGLFSPHSNVATRLRQTFDYLNNVFIEKNSLLRNRTVLQSLATLIARLIDSGRSQGYETKLLKFFTYFMQELAIQVELAQDATDQDFLDFQKSINANVRTAARIRHEIFLRKLLSYEPTFFDVLGPGIVAESGVNGRIKVLGENILNLVSQINTLYSTKRGIDLFKPTNKTASALTRLGKPIKTYNGYKTFIDDLYFIFHEGAAGRLDDQKPESFSDIRDLRTELQHDLDHGSRSKVEAKRMKIGGIFRKYAGTGTPATLNPEMFPLIQVNLLSGIETDLRRLLTDVDKL